MGNHMNEMPLPDVLERLSAQIASRRAADGKTSYTASLFERGEDTILKKVGEEAVEFILAAKENDPAHLVAEAADVWFHMLVLLSANATTFENDNRDTLMGMPSVPQLLIILVIVVLIFGAKRLKNLGGDLGSAVKGFKQAVKEEDEGTAELEDGRKKAETDAEDAVMNKSEDQKTS